jgi:hypothetical protein
MRPFIAYSLSLAIFIGGLLVLVATKERYWPLGALAFLVGFFLLLGLITRRWRERTASIAAPRQDV